MAHGDGMRRMIKAYYTRRDGVEIDEAMPFTRPDVSEETFTMEEHGQIIVSPGCPVSGGRWNRGHPGCE